MVVLARDVGIITDDPTFAEQRTLNGNSSEGTTYNGVVCWRVPITGFNIPSLTTRVQGSVEIVEQVIHVDTLHSKQGVSSYKLNVAGATDDLRVFLLDDVNVYAVVGGVRVLFAYPHLALREGDRLAVSTVHEDVRIPTAEIDRLKELIQESRSHTPLNCSVANDEYELHDSTAPNLQFWFDLQ